MWLEFLVVNPTYSFSVNYKYHSKAKAWILDHLWIIILFKIFNDSNMSEYQCSTWFSLILHQYFWLLIESLTFQSRGISNSSSQKNKVPPWFEFFMKWLYAGAWTSYDISCL